MILQNFLTLFGQTHLQLIILEVVYLVRLKVMGLPEVTNNIDGVSLKTYDAAMTNANLYRTMWEHTAMSYRMSDNRYSREIGFHRCNQSITVGATSGDGSFGGVVFLVESIRRNFAKGSYWSVYGLRLPTGD